MSTLPAAPEAERYVLGLALNNGDARAHVLDYLDEEDFSTSRHRLIYSSIKQCVMDGVQEPDILSVADRLDVADQLDKEIGGRAALYALSSEAESSVNLRHYVKIVRKKARLRDISIACDTMKSLAESSETSPETIVDEHFTRLVGLTLDNKDTRVGYLREAAAPFQDRMERIRASERGFLGIATGFPKLDLLIGGLEGGTLTTVAARTGVGKTAFALQVAGNVSVHEQKTCLFFSAEMSALELYGRRLAQTSGIAKKRIERADDLTTAEWDQLEAAANTLQKSDLVIDWSPRISYSHIRTKTYELLNELRQKGRPELGCVIIDYLQLIQITLDSRKFTNREQEVSELSKGCKELARELDIPVVALAQLNRDVVRRGGRPKLTDLRESGSIESDSDKVLLIHDPSEEPTATLREIDVAKHRNGETGVTAFEWNGPIFSFAEMDDEKYATVRAETEDLDLIAASGTFQDAGAYDDALDSPDDGFG